MWKGIQPVSGTRQQVAPGVHRFTDALANWYAVTLGDGRLVLVDCGWPRSGERLAAGLAELGRTVEDVQAVLLTHGHPDHLGSAQWLSETHGIPVYAGAEELPRVRGERPSTRGPRMLLELWRPSALRFLAGSLERGVLSPRWVVAPQSVDSTFEALIVPVRTPGHTEGHTAYWLPERGVVFSGDALVTLDVLTGRRGPRLHPAPFQVDLRQARESLAALGSIDADVVLPGHGDAFAGPVADAVARAREA
jgi:glyoxylase-like metal-dependent hydrolase (beta-lactamase superfamily II)